MPAGGLQERWPFRRRTGLSLPAVRFRHARFSFDDTEFHHDRPPDRRSAHRLADDRRPLSRGGAAVHPGRPFGRRGRLHRQAVQRHSELGAYLDPVADKALLVSVFVTLGLQGCAAGLAHRACGQPRSLHHRRHAACLCAEQPDGGAPALGVEGEHGGADRPHRLRPRRPLGAHRVRAADLGDRGRGRGADRRLGRRLSRRVGEAHGRRAGRRRNGMRHEPPCAGGVLARARSPSCFSSCGCSAASCCPSSWAWRSLICSTRSPIRLRAGGHEPLLGDDHHRRPVRARLRCWSR